MDNIKKFEIIWKFTELELLGYIFLFFKYLGFILIEKFKNIAVF